MIDGLHHKLATIGTPSRLLASTLQTYKERQGKKKRTRAPIHFPGLFVDSPAKLVTTTMVSRSGFWYCYFFSVLLQTIWMLTFVKKKTCKIKNSGCPESNYNLLISEVSNGLRKK